EQLQAELATMHPEKGTSYEAMIKDWDPVVSDFGLGRTIPWFRRIWLMNWTCLAAVSFLYAIACVNVGSLMLVRAVGRRREIGVRLALGGKRWQVMRPFLVEGLVLSIAAVGLGVIVARWFLPALIALAPGAGDSWSGDVSLSREALGGAIALGLLTGLGTAFVPAWRVARLNLNETVKDGGNAVGESRGLRGLRGSLVIVEAALAVTLLVGTGLMVRTFQKLQHMNPGYETSRRYQLQLVLPRQEQMSVQAHTEKVVQIMERVATVPGVTAAATAQFVAPRANYPTRKLKVRGQAGTENAGEIDVVLNPVSAEYLELMGVPMRAGRSLAGLHRGDAPVAVVNQAAVRKYFPDRNPIGQIFELSPQETFEIVGVAGDVRSARAEPAPACYFPYWQSNSYLNSIVVRTAGEPGKGFQVELRRAVFDVDPKFSVTSITSLEDSLRQETWAERQTLVLLEVLSMLALLLAVVGLFATLAYSVMQRRGEFGIRFALGASVTSVYRLVVARGLALVAIGVALGLGLAWSLARFIESMLFETSTHDPLVFGLVGCAMLLVALPACWLPAMRATKVDLTKLMRSE
ncbi:MAG TPA: FtsX-like permease family protein, partial [Candidatus Didemnitutus sp.]|nr:FtsX-like permease family protein [Candidatus Didemnitutus sp.]